MPVFIDQLSEENSMQTRKALSVADAITFLTIAVVVCASLNSDPNQEKTLRFLVGALASCASVLHGYRLAFEGTTLRLMMSIFMYCFALFAFGFAIWK